MSKIVVFKGSPRKKGFTNQLIDEAIKGAKSKGAEVKIYDLNDDGVKGCQGCFHCRTHEGCATKDYLQPMYEDIKNSDAIIFGTPIYFYQIAGQAKQWIDRLYPVLDGKSKPRYPGKKVFSIFTQGSGDPETYKTITDSINGFFTMFGWNVEKTLICGGTTSPDFKLSDELLKSALQAGETLAK
ncbi:MAG: flavodoxin family protein [Clostridiales bacterium]